MPEEKPEPLTRAQKEQLEAELAELEGPRRADAVKAIATARAFGDLSENFEYHAAKNEQGPPQPVLHPGTGEPVGPDDLAPLFPMELIGQEVSTDPEVPIPDEVLD